MVIAWKHVVIVWKCGVIVWKRGIVILWKRGIAAIVWKHCVKAANKVGHKFAILLAFR